MFLVCKLSIVYWKKFKSYKRKIKNLEKNNKLSINSIAKLLNCDPGLISRIKNRSQKMSMKTAFRISQVFGIDFQEIIMAEDIDV